MSGSKLPGFTKVREDSAQMQKTMEFIDKTLSNPMKLFDKLRCVGAEELIRGELQKCAAFSENMLVSRDLMSTNLENGAIFLLNVVAFDAEHNDCLDSIELQLEPYGYRKYQAAVSFVEPALLQDNQPNAFDIPVDPPMEDTPSFLEINTSLSGLNISNGMQGIKRELSFSE